MPHDGVVVRVTALIACLLVTCAPSRAQTVGPADTAAASDPDEEAGEGAPRFEAEFIASGIFQGGTVALRLPSPLTFEAHYFGVETNEIGTVGLAWTFSRGGLRVVPGIAWSFGSENRPAPVVTARWSYEHWRRLTQGLWVQSLRADAPTSAGEHDEEPAEHEESARHRVP